MNDELFSPEGSKKRIILFVSVLTVAFLVALVFVFLSVKSKQAGFSVEKAREQIQNQSSVKSGSENPQTSGKDITTNTNQIDSTNRKTTQTEGQTPSNQNNLPQGTNPDSNQGGSGQSMQGNTNSQIAIGGQSVEKRMTSNSIAKDVPKVQFDRYQINIPLPILPETVYSYPLKNNFVKEDAISLANKFGMNPESFETQNDYLIVTDNTKSDSNGFLSLHKFSGAFTFLSGGNHFANTSSQDPIDIAKQYMTDIGFSDPEIQVTATYQKTDAPNITFVEAHWIDSKTNLANMEVVSTLNLDTKIPLSSIKTGVVNASAIADPKIYNASDGGNGRERPNQYNTITIGVSQVDDQIIAVTSTLRQKLSAQNRTTAQYLITPDEALKRAQNGQIEFSLVLPSGAGFVDINKLTPSDVVIGQNATLTDFILSYIDKTPNRSHDEYRPYYLMRGNAQVSGYRVSFVQLVSATQQITSSASVLGTSTSRLLAQNSSDTTISNEGDNNALEYGTFQFKAEPTLPPDNPPAGQCPFFTNCYQPKDLCGKICFYPSTLAEARKEGDVGRSWYYIPCDNETIQADSTTQTKWFAARTKALAACNPANASTCPVPSDLKKAVAERCYHITTASPFIYLYNLPQETKTSVSVLPFGGATYADPKFSNLSSQTWDVTNSQSPLYYEFDAKTVLPKIKPLHDKSSGYKVQKSQLLDFIKNKLAPHFGLKTEETSGLSAEVKRELNNLPEGLIKVSFVEQELLSKYLPIKVNPQPKSTSRIILYLSPTTSEESVLPPKLSPITRTGFSVVEVGVMVDPNTQF